MFDLFTLNGHMKVTGSMSQGHAIKFKLDIDSGLHDTTLKLPLAQYQLSKHVYYLCRNKR